MTHDYKDVIEKIDQDLIAHAARIHNVVDETLDKVRRRLREISVNAEMELQTQEKVINDKYEEFKRNIRQLEELLQINDISLLEHKFDIADMKTVPTLSQKSPPCYSSGQIDNQSIEAMIGNLNNSVQNFEKKISSNVREVTRSKESSQQASALVTPVLSTPVVFSSFNPGYNLPYIACTTSLGLAWVRTGQHCVQLVDRDGTSLDTIHTDFEFNDVTVTRQGDVLFSDCTNDRIVSASKGGTSWRITSLFPTPYTPWGICSLRNSDVVITYFYDRRIIQYSSTGSIIHEFDPKLFSYPYRVDVNKVSGDLYFTDTRKNKLLAFDKNHRPRYEYTGSDASSFYPVDVTTDISGRILITDERNDRVHVLNKDGKFLQYIQPTGLKAPRCIDIDSKGHAWIGEWDGKLKIVEF